MFHTDHLAWRILAFCLILIIVALLSFWLRLRSPKNTLRIWQCCRYQGGANVYTPEPMTELQAIEFASALDSVLWVDRNHGFIFYRPQGGH